MFSFIGARVFAQPVSTKTLSKPAQTFAEPFSRIGGIREQSDGRVVVLDRQEIKLVRIDFKTGRSTTLGRSGQGPGEYTLPISLVALPGDTTVATDMSGGRLLVITRDSVSGTPLRSKGFDNNKPLVTRSQVESDAEGRLYEQADRYRAENGRLMQTQFAGIRRLNRSTGAQDTIGMLSRMMQSPLVHPVATKMAAPKNGAPAGALAMRTQPTFPSVDQWAVAPDGRIAMVTVFPYRVAYYAPNGDSTKGPPIAYTPVRMSAALKAQWKETKLRPVPTLNYGGDGKVTAGKSIPRYEEPAEWPEELPPFLMDAVRFAPDGNLWVERTTAARAPQTFDVIDRSGRVASHVVLPAKSRLVGFGKASVYIVRIDEDDLEHLERHMLPR